MLKNKFWQFKNRIPIYIPAELVWVQLYHQSIYLYIALKFHLKRSQHQMRIKREVLSKFRLSHNIFLPENQRFIKLQGSQFHKHLGLTNS